MEFEKVKFLLDKNIRWLKWVAIAACLCLVLIAVFIIPTLSPIITDNEAQIGSIADNSAMIMVDDRLYKDSGEILNIPAGQDGQITSSCDNVPTENNQSNFGTGYSYQYGESDSIYVLLEDGWHIFKLSGSENINMDNLSEQEKMEIDPNYKPNNPPQDDITPPFVTDAATMVYINDTLYKDSAVEISYAELNEDAYLGEIESEVTNNQSVSDGVPNKNFQANHSIVGSKVYQYGDDIVVEINGKYWLYENYTDERKTVNFHGKLFNKSELSKETLEWLQWYNSLSPEEQLAVSYEPYELRADDNSSYTIDAESSIVQELDVDYTTNDDGTYTCRGNIYKYKIDVSGMEGESQVTFTVLTNDTEISFKEVSDSLKKAEMGTGVPEFVILGWY